ncbi:UNVERIFIED_CONTAM: raffinose/stachyose/melibiose transport system substrate-binding protein [Acetivibrio alkalicellulosi]
MKKRLAILLACFMMIVLVLSGCNTGGGSGTTDPTQKPTETDSSGSGTTGEDVTLTLWSISTESDAFHEAYNKAIAEFEASTGVKVNHNTYENESYKVTLATSVSANQLPDVFFTWGGGFSAPFVSSGKVLALDEYYGNYKDQLSQAALDNVTYDGKLYGTTFTTAISVLFYNKKIFEDNGLEPPTTFDELVQVSETLKANGITPIGISARDKWVLAMTHDNLTLKSAGPEKVQSALRAEGQSYNAPEFIESAAKFQKLVEIGAFIEGAAGLTNDEASAEFYAGNTAMFVTGSWMAGSIQTDPENPDDFDAVPYPVVGNNAALTDFMGGPVDSFMVSQSTNHPELAAKLAFELARGISKYGYLAGAGLPVWEVDYDDNDVNPLTRRLASFTESATSFTLWFDTFMEAEQATTYLTLLEQLYFRQITPEQFAQGMDEQLN